MANNLGQLHESSIFFQIFFENDFLSQASIENNFFTQQK